jgi:hypothetical protein
MEVHKIRRKNSKMDLLKIKTKLKNKIAKANTKTTKPLEIKIQVVDRRNITVVLAIKEVVTKVADITDNRIITIMINITITMINIMTITIRKMIITMDVEGTTKIHIKVTTAVDVFLEDSIKITASRGIITKIISKEDIKTITIQVTEVFKRTIIRIIIMKIDYRTMCLMEQMSENKIRLSMKVIQRKLISESKFQNQKQRV